MAKGKISEDKMSEGVKGKKVNHGKKCRGCGHPRSENESVRVGGRYYHSECAEKKTKARQEYRNGGWVRL